jgi:hypothetical protein
MFHSSHFQVFQPLLKMCVLPQGTPCFNGKVNSGNSKEDIFEGKNIEIPNTAPDAAAAVLDSLHNSGNVHHQTLHTTTNTKSDANLQLSTRPPYVKSTGNQIISPEGIAYQVKFPNLLR